MANANDPYIVRFYGVYQDQNKHYCIVMKYISGLALSYNFQNMNLNLPWNSVRWKIGLDIVRGLNFLQAKKILHRDLKSDNILLNTKFRAKLTDFGLAMVKNETRSSLYSNDVSTQVVGTYRWMAPELLGLRPDYSVASDRFAYGIVLWELSTRKVPFEETTAIALCDAIKSGEYVEALVEELDEYPETPKTIKSLIHQVCSQIRSNRLTTENVTNYLLQHGTFSKDKQEVNQESRNEQGKSSSIDMSLMPDLIKPF